MNMGRGRRTSNKKTTEACRCDKCHTEAYSVPGKEHRRCVGQPHSGIRSKTDKLSADKRGEWQAA